MFDKCCVCPSRGLECSDLDIHTSRCRFVKEDDKAELFGSEALDPALARGSSKYPLPPPKLKPRPGRLEFGNIDALDVNDIKCRSECRYGKNHDNNLFAIKFNILHCKYNH